MKTETRNGVTRATYDAIESVWIKDLPERYYGQYSERPSRYLVKFHGETRKRRVYASPIGNVSVFYVKTKDGNVYVEMALDAAMHRKDEES